MAAFTPVVLSPLPVLYIYDHCPFCTRVRYLLGVKKVKAELRWLLSDDVATGTRLIGKKAVPIWAPNADADGGPYIPESLDICRLVDGDAKYGPTAAFREASGRTDIAEWFKKNAVPIKRLQFPRLVAAHLPEYSTQDARAAYMAGHKLEDPSDYGENLKKSAEYAKTIQAQLPTLDECIHSPQAASEGGLSFDDIDLFPRLRLLSLVKGLEWPDKLSKYMQHHSKLSDVALYTVFAS